MTDIFDRASEVEQRERDAALSRQAAITAEHEPPFEIEGKRVCLECYEPIARKRLAVNPQAVRCIECQNDHDRRRKRGLA